MNKSYEIYEGINIDKFILDSISIGDLVKINNWKKPMRVKGASENYFVMTSKHFGETICSVCEKKPHKETSYNNMINGMFHVGGDGWIFGAPI